jgi:hypothetical protein
MISCTSDNKIKQIATDMCDCFVKMDKNLSEKTKSIIATASNADNPETSLQSAMLALNEEEQTSIGTEMMALGELENPSSEVGGCIKAVEKKYDDTYTLNEKKDAEKIVKELESRSGCGFTASLLKLGLKMDKD